MEKKQPRFNYRDASLFNSIVDYHKILVNLNKNGLKVPDVLLSGNHQLIEDWKNSKKIEVTKDRRPDLWKKYKEKNK